MATPGVVITPELTALLGMDVPVGQTLKVAAAAGTGKSTALRMYAASRPQLRFLYLTFSRPEACSKREEYAAAGMAHVTVSTLHALAYEATQDLHRGQASEAMPLTAAFLSRATRTSSAEWPRPRRALVHAVLDNFAASTAHVLSGEHLPDGSQANDGLLSAARCAWHAACDPLDPMPPSHDLYLKASLLSFERRVSMFRDVDVVLLDEAQDCTGAQLALVVAPAERTWASILVFDHRQRLYGWRRAASRLHLDSLPAMATLYLSHTWRFGSLLASLASAVVQCHGAYGEQECVIGNAQRSTVIVQVAGPPFGRVCGAGTTLAVVAKTNRALFAIAAEAVECTAVERIIVGDGSASIFDMFGGEDRLVDALSLRMGCGVHQFSTSDCRAALFSEVGYAAYRAAAASRQWKADIEACYAVDRFGASLWDLVRRLRRACRSSSAANVVLLTVHAAKGGEWSHVYVHTDLQKSLRAEGDAAEYELNLLYVAITRARKMLYLPPPLVVSWIERAGIII